MRGEELLALHGDLGGGVSSSQQLLSRDNVQAEGGDKDLTGA
jgi:hypothetical protein